MESEESPFNTTLERTADLDQCCQTRITLMTPKSNHTNLGHNLPRNYPIQMCE